MQSFEDIISQMLCYLKGTALKRNAECVVAYGCTLPNLPCFSFNTANNFLPFLLVTSLILPSSVHANAYHQNAAF